MKAKKGSNQTSPAKKNGKSNGANGFRKMKTGDGTEIDAPIANKIDIGSLAHAAPPKLNGKANGFAKLSDHPELKEKLEAAGATPVEADPFENDKPVTPPPLPPRTRHLPCVLNDQERLAIGATMASTLGKIDEIDAQIDSLKESASLLKKERDVLETKVLGEGRALSSGRTFRDIECKEVEGLELHPADPDSPRNGIRTIRLDTNEVFEWRARTAAEMQGSLFDEGGTQFADGAP